MTQMLAKLKKKITIATDCRFFMSNFNPCPMKKLFVFVLCLFWISLSVSHAETKTSSLVTLSEGFHLKKPNAARKIVVTETGRRTVTTETEKKTLAEVICSFRND